MATLAFFVNQTGGQISNSNYFYPFVGANVPVSYQPLGLAYFANNDSGGILQAGGLAAETVITATLPIVIQAQPLFGSMTVVARTAPVTVFGGFGDIVVANGSATGSLVVGGLGNTTVSGGTGSITAFGASGSSLLVGGSAGGNVLVGGSGFATLIGGGSGDLLFATNLALGTRQVLSAGGGNETLVGGGTTQGNTYFAGNNAAGVTANTVIGAGVGNDTIFAGTGNATVDGGAGADLVAIVNGRAGGAVLVNGFDAGSGDRITLQGYAPGAVQAAVASSVAGAAGVTVTLSDNTRITFGGLARIDAGAFV